MVASVSGYKERAAAANLSDASAKSLKTIRCFGDIQNTNDWGGPDSREMVPCFGRGPNAVHAPGGVAERGKDIRVLGDRHVACDGHCAVGGEDVGPFGNDHRAGSRDVTNGGKNVSGFIGRERAPYAGKSRR